MPEFQDYTLNDDKNVTVRAYKGESGQEIPGRTGAVQLTGDEYVVDDGNPNAYDTVPSSWFEENYSPVGQVSTSNDIPAGDDQSESDYDPSLYSVAEVLSYIAQNPDEKDAILEKERQGKNRPTIVNS